MDFKLYTYSNNKEECKKVFDDIIKDILSYIDKMDNLEIEHYWKFDEMYVLDVEIYFKEAISEEIFMNFLYSISDKWDIAGVPWEAVAYASETTEGCKYIKKDISLICIHFDENDVALWEDRDSI